MTTPQTPTPAALNPLSEAAAALAIEASCRTLGLPSVRHNYPGYTAAAVAQRLTHTGLLAELLAAEVDDRHDRRIARRLKDARLPRMKRLTDFDPDPLPDLSPALLARLGDPGWITAGHPLVLLGDSGTGKTHLLIGVAVAAAEHDLKVRYTTAAALVNELVEAADHKALTRTLNRYARLDLLCCDELGYVHLDPRGAELLFQIITAREERASIAVASNAPLQRMGRHLHRRPPGRRGRRPVDLPRHHHHHR